MPSSTRTTAVKRAAAVALAAVGLLACNPNPSLPNPTRPAVNTRPVHEVRVDATGRTDVTAAINNFIASVPDGSTIRFAQNGRYRIDGFINILRRHELTIDGNGSTFFAPVGSGDRNRRHWLFSLSHDIVFRNAIIRGANPHAGLGDNAYRSDREGQHAVQLGGVRNFVMHDVQIYDPYADGVYIGRQNHIWSDGVILQRNLIQRVGRQGVTVIAARNVLISNNIITETRRSTIDFEPLSLDDWGAEDVVIQDNLIGPGRLNFIAAHGKGPVNRITVANNTLVGRGLSITVQPETAGRRHGWHILNNTSDTSIGNPGGAAMSFERIDDLVVRGNTQPLDHGRNMVMAKALDSCDVAISGNHIPGGVGQSRLTGTHRCS